MGLDIGTSKVVAIVGEVNEEGNIEVVGIGSHPSRGLKKGVVVNIESTVHSIQRAVERVADSILERHLRHCVSEALRGYKIIMQRGHGAFAIGQTPEEAYHWISTLEEACDIILEAKLMNEEFIEYRKHSDSYAKW